jgi:hypothetical protein
VYLLPVDRTTAKCIETGSLDVKQKNLNPDEHQIREIIEAVMLNGGYEEAWTKQPLTASAVASFRILTTVCPALK